MHRSLCLGIAEFQQYVQEEEERIRAVEDVFVTSTGDLWGYAETTAYMEATYALSDLYWQAAYQCEVKEVWEKALYHLLEHLRLGAIDTKGARARVPFVLLALNRDDEALTFIQYWVQVDLATEDDPEIIFRAHENTKEGDWIYGPVEKDGRYLDIFQVVSDADPNEVEVPFLVALAIMKLRIVAAYDTAIQSLRLAMTGTAGRVHEVQSAIQDMLIRGDLQSQWEQLIRLLDAIDHLNPSMLPAILNPKPLFQQPPPTQIMPGHPSEAFRTLMDCRRCFYRVPGAAALLRNRLGENPTYDSDMS
jgi:hypothetical protein